MKLNITIAFLLLLLTTLCTNTWAQNPNAANVILKDLDTVTKSHGKAIFNEVVTKNKVSPVGTEGAVNSLPLGISKEINGKSYVIAIDSTTYENGQSYLSAYTEFTIPGTDVGLIFTAKNISFTPNSLRFTNNTRLQLENDAIIDLGKKVKLVLRGNGRNYIDWDCNGFKAISLEGDFLFDNGMLISALEADINKPDAYVTASFKLYATDFNNMLAAISISPFQIKNLKDFIFEVQEATVDMSDVVNPQGMALTSVELDSYGGNAALWRGFYLKKLQVTLPSSFSKETGERASVSASNLRIDDFGVTGNFGAKNILKLGDASAGGWPISIDSIDVQLVHNKLRGGALGGDLRVSLLGDTPLRYIAQIQDRDSSTYYSFMVSLQDTVTFKTFVGNISLNPNSNITLEKIGNDFVGTAVLHGRVDINEKLLKAPGIIFQDLTVTTKKPYVVKGIFSVDGNINCKIAGYGIQFERLTLGIDQGKLALSSKVTFDLMNKGDKGFSASAQISVVANKTETSYTAYVGKTPVERTKVKWVLDKVKVSAIAIDIKVSAFTLKGVIQLFDNDPVYGNGFQGALSVKIPALPADIRANGYFGTKTDSAGSFKYYHVDVKVPMPSGVILFPGVSLYAITGGLSYRMERPNDFDPYAIARNNALSEASFNVKDSADAMKMVEPFLKYVPERKAGYGFLAGVTIGTTGTKSLINADLMFEVMLGIDGGLRYVQFDGSMFAVAPFELRGKYMPKDEAGTAAIFVQAKIRYDNDEHSLHGSCKTYINTPGGAIQGIGERGLVGEVQFHFDKHNWWFYIGRPSQMFGLNMAHIAQVKNYFQVGTKVEDMPPLPAEVGNILGENSLNSFMDKENALSTGRGFGFGAHFKISFGVGEKSGPVYAFFKAGAGVDVLLRDYGNARCKGSGELGINGWYASGQAYAFIEGRVGIRVKLFAKTREIDIAHLGAAVILQAKLPNPAWFRGVVGVKFSVLGGLIKGQKTVKFELGTQCELVSGKEINIQIIKDFLPDSAATDVSVFAAPQASFNLAVDKPFSMMNNEDVVTTYRIKLDAYKFNVNNTPIQGEVSFTADKDAVSFLATDVLPPNSNIKGVISLLVEKESGIGNWVKVIENGAPMTERKTVTFTTGDGPENIPNDNVAFSYPIHKQYNFLTKEYNQGYIQLKRGQAYLFRPSTGTGNNMVEWKYAAHFEANDGEAIDMPLAYDSAKRVVQFNIPESLKNNMVYKMGIIKMPLNGGNASNNVQQQSTTTVEDEGDTTTVTTKTLKGMALAENAVLMYQLSFRSSKFNTLREKIAGQRAAQDVFDISTNVQPIIGKRYDTDEAFDKFDMEGTTSIAVQPLIQISASEDNAWLQNSVKPLLYNPYETFTSLGLGISYRNTQLLGIAPLKAVKVYNNDVVSFELTEGEMGETILAGKTGRIRYMYFINHFSNLDHFDMRNKAVANYINGGAAPEPVRNLMLNVFPELEANRSYKIKISYVLPGTNIISSTVEDEIMFR
jgi:hypothetical protein